MKKKFPFIISKRREKQMKHFFANKLLAAIVSLIFLSAGILTYSIPTYAKSNQRYDPILVHPKEGMKKAAEALHKALDDKDWAEVAYYMIEEVASANIINRNNVASGLATIDSIISIVPPEWKSAFMLIKADYYTYIFTDYQLFSSFSWKRDNRILSLDYIPSNPKEWSGEIYAHQVYNICKDILEDESLESLPLKRWKAFLSYTDYAFSVGMTVREYCALQCYKILDAYAEEATNIIPFFPDDIQSQTPTQKCRDLRDKALDILIQESEDRGQSFLLAKALVYKAECLPSGLGMEAIFDAWRQLKHSEGEQYILSYLSDFTATEWNFSKSSTLPISNDEYIQMIKESIAAYPKGKYVKKLKEIIERLSQPYIDVRYHGQYLTDSDISMEVNLFNTKECWLLVYDYSSLENSRFKPILKSVLPKCQFVKAVKVTSDGSSNKYIPNATAEIGPLPAGSYIFAPSASPKAKGIFPIALNDAHNEPFRVSDIRAITLQKNDTTTQIYVVNAQNGMPIKGASVNIYRPYHGKNEDNLIKTLITDSDGCVSVSEQKFEFEVMSGGSKWSSKYSYYNYASSSDAEDKRYVDILADGNLFHPEDSIHAAVISYKQENGEYAIDANRMLYVVLVDGNGRKVASKRAVTDEYGRANVEFKIPDQGNRGRWRLKVVQEDGETFYKDILIEDYVNPTFYISIDKNADLLKVGDDLVASGQIMTYSGMPLADATVKYSVLFTSTNKRNKYFRGEYNSMVTSDSEGRFKIDLPTTQFKNSPFDEGIYTIDLSATSLAGETQTGSSLRFALGTPLEIAPTKETVKLETSGEMPPVAINVEDVLGRKIEKELKYTLTNEKTDEVVAEGIFTSPTLILPRQDYPSGVYSLEASLLDDPDCDADMEIIMWKKSDVYAPAGTTLWTPQNRLTANENDTKVNVKIGSGVPDRWIAAVLSSDDEKVLSFQWIHVADSIVDVAVSAPRGNSIYQLNLTYTSDTQTEEENIRIFSAEDQRLQIKTSSFRNKITAGDEEHWTFQFHYGNKNASVLPAFAVMTDAALNALAPFNWTLSPHSYKDISFAEIGRTYDYYQSYRQILKRPSLKLAPRIFWPSINLHFTGWGFGRYGSYDFENDPFDGIVYGYGVVRTSDSSSAEVVKIDDKDDEDDFDEDDEENESIGGILTGMAFGISSRNDDTSSSSSNDIPPRDSECPIAFFMPNLLSDSTGIVEIDFKVPNFNTTWAFQLLGYDEHLQTAKISLETVASKPVMVSTHLPRFVRTGDEINLTATVFNNTDLPMPIKGRIEVIDLFSGRCIYSEDFKQENQNANSSRIIKSRWIAPDNLSAVGFRAYAIAENHQDGEEGIISVRPSSTPIVESDPFWLSPDEHEKKIKLAKFESSANVSLQYCDNAIWNCLTALPCMIDWKTQRVCSMASSLFGMSTAYHLISSRPELKEALESLLSDIGSRFAAIKSSLGKNEDLKITQLGNTPWVNNAESEAIRMCMLSSLLDDNEARRVILKQFEKVRDCQDNNGGWGWYKGASPSAFITMEVLKYFAMMQKTGSCLLLPDFYKVVSSANKFVYSHLSSGYQAESSKNISTDLILDWMYILSNFPADSIPFGESQKEVKQLMSKGRKVILERWRNMGIQSKSKAAIVMWRAGNAKAANEILESILEFSEGSEDKGLRFGNIKSGIFGAYEIAVQTLVLEALAEIRPSDNAVDRLRQELLLSFAYQEWGWHKEISNTVYAILTYGSDWSGLKSVQTAAQKIPEFKLQGKPLSLPKAAALTGAFTMEMNAADASQKTLAIIKNGNYPAWGGVISQYETPILNVKESAVADLSIRKSIVVLDDAVNTDITSNHNLVLKKGMKIRVNLFITAERNLDYVVVNDERSACLEPCEQLSGFFFSDGVGYYKEVRDSETNLCFTYLPKGTYVISYDCNVSQEGLFSCGIATAQSQYNPLIVAHSAGSMLQVRN